MSRRRAVGMTIGALWLIVAGAAFATWALVMINTTVAVGGLVVMLMLVAALIVVGVAMVRAVLRLPGRVPPKTPREERMGRQFVWVVVAEFAAFMVVNGFLSITKRFIFIEPLDLIIVGIHFLPLAYLFDVRRYYLMGALFCAIPALTLLAVSRATLVGDVQAWYVLPSLGCSAVAVLTGAASLREVKLLLKQVLA